MKESYKEDLANYFGLETYTVNEITAISETIGYQWKDPAHDNNGNMTTIPQPKDLTKGYTATWDAWNRLVN